MRTNCCEPCVAACQHWSGRPPVCCAAFGLCSSRSWQRVDSGDTLVCERAGWHYEHSSQPGQKLGPRTLQGLQRLPAAHLNLLFERVESAHMQRQFEPSDVAPAPTPQRADQRQQEEAAIGSGTGTAPQRPQGHVHVVDKSHDLSGLERHPLVKLWFRKNFSFQSAELEDAYERQRALFFREANARDYQVEASEHMLLQLSEADTGGAQDGGAQNDENLAGSRLQLIPEASEGPAREPFSRLIDSVILVVPDAGKPFWARNVTYWAASLLLLGWPLRFYCELRTAYVCFHVHKSFARLDDAATEADSGCSALPHSASVPLDSDDEGDDADDLVFQNGSPPLARDPTMCTLDLDLHLAQSTKRAPSYAQAATTRAAQHTANNIAVSRSERPESSRARVPAVRSVLPASVTLVDLPHGCCDQCRANGAHMPLQSSDTTEGTSGSARVSRSRTFALLESAARLGGRLRLPNGLTREPSARSAALDTEERLLARPSNGASSASAAAAAGGELRVSHSVSMPVNLSLRAACSRL